MLLGILLLAASAAAHSTPSSRILRRANEEHVALCDCQNKDNVVSSQMAYFPGVPGAAPQDVATIAATPDGQARVWSSATTSALFTLTQTTFTAKLGPQVAVGALAGTGDNGYPDPFNCWFVPKQALYVYDGWTCAMVYDCSHDAANSTVSTTTSSSPTSTSTSSSNQQSNSQVLSTPALIGVAVGSGLATLIAMAAIGFVCLHRRRARAEERRLEEQLRQSQSGAKSLYGGVLGADGKWHQTIKPGPPQELDGNYRGLEIHAGPTGGYREIDSMPVAPEGKSDASGRNRWSEMIDALSSRK